MLLTVGSVFGVAVTLVVLVAVFDARVDLAATRRRIRALHQLRPEPMDAFEYQRFYDCGVYPERFWPEEMAKLRAEFAAGTITSRELEDSLDDMMGITPLEQANRGYRNHRDGVSS